MAGKSKKEALDDFCGFFKESLSCITDQFLQPIQISDNRYSLTYATPAELLCEKESYALSVTQVFTVARDKGRSGYKTQTLQYSYTLNANINAAPRGIVEYHWHPDESEVRFPHLHIAAVPRVHFPTSRVSIERFIRMLIDYYGVQPLLAESKWKEILKRNNRAFDEMATWK